MHFQDQQYNQSYDKQSSSQETFAELCQDQGAEDTIKFKFMAKLFTCLSEARGGKKSKMIKGFLTLLFKKNRKPQFTHSILRLIIPEDDKARGNYGLKEKALAKLITQSLKLSKAEYQRLYHYKNPNYHKEGMGIGDFSICMYDVIKGYLTPNSTLTVRRLNQILDLLASSTDQAKHFTDLIKQSNAAEMKWIVRIILKDLKLGIKIDTVLTTFHPDGNQYYNLVNSLQQTCKKFQNPKISLSDQVQLFHLIRPMLAGKKKIEYFKNETRTFYIQTKYDGERLQVHVENDRVMLFSRNGVDENMLYEDIANAVLEAVQAEACILDGEIIVIDIQENKMIPFGMNKVVALGHQNKNLQLCYKIFDIMWLRVENQEMNLMGYPLRQRKKILPKVVNEIPGRIELVKFREILQYDDILKEFNASLQREEEGVMLKDPNSIYVPKQRSTNWLKLKGDYVDGMTDTMDVIIIGGYFGDLSFRNGKQGSHWTNQVTSFLVAVLDIAGPEDNRYYYSIPFARVGSGFSQEVLIQLRAKLKPHLYQFNGKNKPDHIRCQWKYTIQNKPDCFIDNLKHSVILQVKAAEIVGSENFATDCTLRFARSTRVRYDKDWTQGLTKQQLDVLLDEAQYTKTIKRKNEEHSDEDDDPEVKEISRRKNRADVIKKQPVNRDILLDDFTAVDVSQEKLHSHIFHNKEFTVLPLDNCEYTTKEIERMIWLNDGRVSKNPLKTTHYIVTNQHSFKTKVFENYEKKKFTFIKPKYIANCISAERILPLSPLYLAVLPSHNSKFYHENFDKFGDNYTANLDLRELNEILSEMGNKDYPINEELMKVTGFQYSRSGKVSICFGLTTLQKVKLCSNGNRIVDTFEEFPNSVIISKNKDIDEETRQQITQYLNFNEEAELEHIENLIEFDRI